jgi:hypothetical protein
MRCPNDDTTLVMSEPQPATHAPAPQQYAQPSYPQSQQPYRKKRENWLSELFD